jgi:hypothetical protein
MGGTTAHPDSTPKQAGRTGGIRKNFLFFLASDPYGGKRILQNSVPTPNALAAFAKTILRNQNPRIPFAESFLQKPLCKNIRCEDAIILYG